MTTKKLPYLEDTGLFKMYLKLCTVDELKAMGYYKGTPTPIKWSFYEVPRNEIIALYEKGLTETRIAKLLKVSRVSVVKTISKLKGGAK